MTRSAKTTQVGVGRWLLLLLLLLRLSGLGLRLRRLLSWASPAALNFVLGCVVGLHRRGVRQAVQELRLLLRLRLRLGVCVLPLLLLRRAGASAIRCRRCDGRRFVRNLVVGTGLAGDRRGKRVVG